MDFGGRQAGDIVAIGNMESITTYLHFVPVRTIPTQSLLQSLVQAVTSR